MQELGVDFVDPEARLGIHASSASLSASRHSWLEGQMLKLRLVKGHGGQVRFYAALPCPAHLAFSGTAWAPLLAIVSHCILDESAVEAQRRDLYPA